MSLVAPICRLCIPFRHDRQVALLDMPNTALYVPCTQLTITMRVIAPTVGQ